MATADSRSATVTCAHHVPSDWNSDSSHVGCMACPLIDDRHTSLLQDVVHVSRMTDLAPSCDVALGSYWEGSSWKTGWLYVLVESDWASNLDHSDVEVECSRVVTWMLHDTFSWDVYLRSLATLHVVLSNSDSDLSC